MSNSIFGRTTAHKAGFEITHSADGKVWAYAIAHDALVLNTPYLIIGNEYGAVTSATSASSAGYIGVADRAWDSGDYVFLQVGGPVTAMVTPSLTGVVGYGVTIASDIVALNSADYIGAAAEFAVFTAASTTATTQAVMLVPKVVTCG